MRIFILISVFFGVCLSQAQTDSVVNAIVVENRYFPSVGPEWTDEYRTLFYNNNKPTHKIMGPLMYESPIASPIERILEITTSNFSKQAEVIAKKCKDSHPNLVWPQISCAARSVNATFEAFRWSDYSTFCRAHAEAFYQVFTRLNIPKSSVGKYDASHENRLHVINRITLTDQNGRTFAYAMDVGWDPNRIFPSTQMTQEFHGRNGRALPQISFALPSDPTFRPQTDPKSCPKKPTESNLAQLWALFNFSGR